MSQIAAIFANFGPVSENIPCFEDDIQAKTEVHTYLSSVGDLGAILILLTFGLLQRSSFQLTWTC